jgi:AsmA protein
MAKAKFGWRRTALIVVGVVGAVVLIATGAAALWLAKNPIAHELELTLSHNLGREVRITKGVRLVFWPVIGVEAGGLSIANIEGGQAAHLMEADSMDVAVSTLPLLTGHVEIRKVILNGAAIHFEKEADGRVNWNLTKRQPQPNEKPPEWLKDLRIDDLSVQRSTVTFFDGQSKLVQSLANINLSLKLGGLDHPALINGNFDWLGETAEINLTANDPRTLLNGGRSPVALSLKSKPLNLAITGVAGIAPGPIEGDVDMSGPSLRELARLAGKPMKPGPGLGAFSVKGRLTKVGQQISFDHARIGLDHIAAAGQLSVDTSEARPFVKGDVTTANLDLNPYLGPEPPPARAWPTTPIDLQALRAFDGDLNLAAGHVQFRKIGLSNARLHVRLQDGVADIGIGEMALYGGAGSGSLRLADLGTTGGYGFRFQLHGVQAKTFFSDLAKIDRIEGTASGTVTLAAQGRNVDQIMHALSGKASLTVNNGAVVGADLGALSGNLASALSRGAVGPGARTAFTVGGGDFTVLHGVAATKNLSLTGAGLGVAGLGSANLGERSLDVLLKPQGSAGFGGRKINLGAVPFRVHGPWSALKYEPDVGGVAQALLSQQAGALIGSGGGDSALGGLLGGVLGGNADSSPATKPSKSKSAPPPADANKTKSPSINDLIGAFSQH